MKTEFHGAVTCSGLSVTDVDDIEPTSDARRKRIDLSIAIHSHGDSAVVAGGLLWDAFINHGLCAELDDAQMRQLLALLGVSAAAIEAGSER